MKPTQTLMLGAALLTAAASLSATNDATITERGRYLVHDVAMCIDCHSPRGEKGAFIEERHLSGAVLDFTATVPMPWAPFAPSLLGLENFTADEAVRFFMTGERPSGMPPLPPMPAFRMNKGDTEAVVAYLKSLKPIK
jgi:mono/diheme cytochrome c family protein